MTKKVRGKKILQSIFSQKKCSRKQNYSKKLQVKAAHKREFNLKKSTKQRIVKGFYFRTTLDTTARNTTPHNTMQSQQNSITSPHHLDTKSSQHNLQNCATQRHQNEAAYFLITFSFLHSIPIQHLFYTM